MVNIRFSQFMWLWGRKSFPKIYTVITLAALNDSLRLQISAHMYAEEDILIRESVCAVRWLGSATTWDLGDQLPFSVSVSPFLPSVQGSYNGTSSCETWQTALLVPTPVTVSTRLQSSSPSPLAGGLEWLGCLQLGLSHLAATSPLARPPGQRYIVSVKVCASRTRHFTTWSQSVRHWKGDKDNKRDVVSW